MKKSDSIKELATALAKTQAEIRGAVKDSENPFFKSNYADLASVWDACRGPLAKNNLAVAQTTQRSELGTELVTTLMHSSGEWIEGELPITPTKHDAQGIGSAISYARRYALAAMVGVFQIDDDAESAVGRSKGQNNNFPPLPLVPLVCNPVEIRPNLQALPTDGIKMASTAQSSMIWARLKNELTLNDHEARAFIIQHSGKQSSKDLTSEDIKTLVKAIDADLRAGVK